MRILVTMFIVLSVVISALATTDKKPKKKVKTIKVITTVDQNGKSKTDTIRNTIVYGGKGCKVIEIKMDSLDDCDFEHFSIDLDDLKGLEKLKELKLDSIFDKDMKVFFKSMDKDFKGKKMEHFFMHHDSKPYWVDETHPSIISIEKEKIAGGKEKITIIRKLSEKK
ncbi:hypothetical protein EMN47_18720 [Prolixibacteraceae bacterium JC049]|nr:hypothetical protein [Prolixibacteraceae bacterium JC049]